jgi:S1-C subfamily serine protease
MDQPSGLALIKTELTGTVPFELAPEPVPAGNWVVLASIPRQDEGVAVALAPGPVLARRASIRLQGVDWPDLMVAAVSLRPGTAAAPLLDPQGRLVAVVVGGGTTRGGVDCLALPADRLVPILKQLREGRSRRLGWLGLAILQEPGGREGVRVKATLEGSPAQAAGIQADDVLLQVGESTIDSPAVLAREVAEGGPGRTVAIKLLRGNEVKTVRVAITPRPFLICGGFRRPSDDLVQVRWRKAVGPFFSAEAYARDQERISELLEQNLQLRERVLDLEGRLRAAKEEKR